jgi:hypothetical protein
MIRLRPTPASIPVEGFPVREKQISSHGRRFLLTGLAVVCFCTASTDLKAGDPCVAEANWYAPYTQEGNCAPYKRTYGYTRTRWHRWPTVSKPMPEPETVSTPQPGMPPAEPSAESSEELPEPDASKVPEPTTEPGPSPDEPDMPPVPPSGSEPAVPPGVNDDSKKPSEDLDDLFPDESPAAMDESKDEPKDESKDNSEETPSDSPDGEPPATGDSSPEGESEDAMPQSRHGGGRRTSFNPSSADTKMHWRRSSRVAPTGASDGRISGEDGRGATVGRGATKSPWQEVVPATPAGRSTSNPLRGTRSVVPTGATQSQSLAETGVVPAVADWSAASLSGSSPSSRGNPLRGGQ